MHTSPDLVTFDIAMEPCTQALCRVLGLVAQQDLGVGCLDVRTEDGSMRVALGIVGLDDHRAAVMAERIRAILAVRSVALRA